MRSLHRQLRGVRDVSIIARAFNVSRPTVYRHIADDATAQRRAHVVHRPPILSDADQKRFSDWMDDYGPVANKELPGIILEHFHVEVSVPTARRYLQKNGLRHYTTQKGPSIKGTDKKARVAAARRLLRDLKHCLFLDESSIGHFHHADPKYWGREAGRSYRPYFPSTIRSNCVGAVTFTKTPPCSSLQALSLAPSLLRYLTPFWGA